MRRCHKIELARKEQRILNEKKRAEKKIENGCTLKSEDIVRIESDYGRTD
jgi:hypothetical protein